MLRQCGVPGQLPVLAVNRHEVARTHQVQNQLQLFRAGVPGDVHRRIHGSVNHVGAPPRDVIDHPVDRLLVTGNDARAQNDGVARLQREMLVIIDGDARQRGHRLALRAGDHDAPPCRAPSA